MGDDWSERRNPPIHRRPSPPRPSEPSQVIRRDPRYPLPPVPTAPRRPPPPIYRAPAPPQRPPAPPRPPATAKPRRKRRWGRWLTAIMVALLVAVIGFAVWVDRSLHRVPVIADYPGRPAAGHGTTWLLVGSDSRSDLSPEQQDELATGGDIGTGRTDTIMLIHVPALTADVPPTVVSIPRDSYVPIPGYGTDKLNAAFSLEGPRLLLQAVEQATGIRVDHYAEIGFLGVVEVVDALGGVPICLTDPVREEEYAHIDLPAGCQTLDGRNALGYVRTRYAFPDADLRRVKNQREFMAALLQRTASPAVWLNPIRWFSVPRAITDALTVDEGAHVWDLARLARALDSSPVTLTVPNTASGDYVEWNEDDATRLFTALNYDKPIPQDLL